MNTNEFERENFRFILMFSLQLHNNIIMKNVLLTEMKDLEGEWQ
jgi:hypothetical protein